MPIPLRPPHASLTEGGVPGTPAGTWWNGAGYAAPGRRPAGRVGAPAATRSGWAGACVSTEATAAWVSRAGRPTGTRLGAGAGDVLIGPPPLLRVGGHDAGLVANCVLFDTGPVRMVRSMCPPRGLTVR